MDSIKTSRRDVLLSAAATTLVGVAARAAGAAPVAAATPAGSDAAGAFTLPPLPYSDNALDPVISAHTIGFHYGKHHKAYVDNLNKAVAGTPFAEMGLSQIITSTYGKADQTALYNNAAQAWNHTFYWNSLRKGGGGEPPAALRQKIEADFGSVENCK